jgi:hypothetical protein
MTQQPLTLHCRRGEPSLIVSQLAQVPPVGICGDGVAGLFAASYAFKVVTGGAVLT